ncbi:hypothetical protein ACIPEN_22105 [Herbaspirillum chlorophenolicum]|uniref:Uncharacterized protein n=1 Tax=Herbaspirillum chlorophenolicum TaxID=211589 RepID=A0ABW8F5G8_9BURK
MEQVVIQEVTYAEYTAARIDDPNSTQEEVLIRLFEGKGIRMKNGNPVQPATIFFDDRLMVFVIHQQQ